MNQLEIWCITDQKMQTYTMQGDYIIMYIYLDFNLDCNILN